MPRLKMMVDARTMGDVGEMQEMEEARHRTIILLSNA